MIDVKKGLNPLRKQWVLDRNDVEQLPGISWEYGQKRAADKNLDSLRFAHIQKPLRAKKGANVSQMYYAKKGIITPEMEYIAIREKIKKLIKFNSKPLSMKEIALVREHLKKWLPLNLYER